MADSPVDLVTEQTKVDPSTPLLKKMKKKWILIGGIFFVVLAAAGSILFFAPGLLPESLHFFGSKEPSKPGKKEDLKTQGFIYNMDAFVVNLADAESPRYLKAKIDIESDESKGNEEYQKRLPQLRDAILTILGSKTYKEIYDSEGKKKLKEEITLKANQLLSSFKVKTIYFTEFVIQ